MNRYNHGFFKFGMMEQAEHGEWIKTADHDKDHAEYFLVLSDLLERLDINNKYIGKCLKRENDKDKVIIGIRKELSRQREWQSIQAIVFILLAITTYFIGKLFGV